MAAITGRFTALEDVSVFTVDANNVKALFRSATLEVTADEIDVTALLDAWKKREYGTYDWRVTCSKLISASPVLMESMISGGTILVSFATDAGFNFLGTGMISGAPLNVDNPMTEDITILSAGASPVITFV